VRAALCYDLSSARNSREHNDANVLTLGAGLIGEALAKQIVDLWLTTSCTVQRYLDRVQQIKDIEEGKITVSQTKVDSNLVTSQEGQEDLPPDDLQKIIDRVQALLKEEFGVSLDELADFKKQIIMDGRGVSMEKSHTAMRDFINMGVGRVTCTLGNGKDIPQDIARCIDHTLLRPDATEDDVRKLCEEALQYKFASVCVNPTYISFAASILRGSPVEVCSVVGFPFGTHSPEIKAMETRQAIRNGAKEIDMVINIGALKSGNDDLLFRDIRAVVEACEDGAALSKVIIEAALLNDEEKVKACQVARRARADYVKTSTGFGPGGATAHDVALMREAVKGTKMGIKAAGGIRSYADAKKMISAGATRIGASAGIQILKEAKELTES
jgi:deoxyribose-phosphate aldolase